MAGPGAFPGVDFRHRHVIATNLNATPTLAIEAGKEAWILQAELAGSRARVEGDARVVAGILHGDRSGLEAFLQHKIRVSGSLSLALQLETLFGNGRHPQRYARSRRVTAAGLDTFYLECGTGSPVILLHGLGATNASMLTSLWALSRHHRVIAPDLPGHGETAKPAARYDAAYFGRWLVAFSARLGLERPHLVGNSLGGRIALEVAIAAPDRVDRVALLAAAPVVHKLRQLVPVARMLRPEMAVVPLPLGEKQALSILRNLFAEPSRMPLEWFEAAAAEFSRVWRQPGARVAFFSALREIYLEEPHGESGYWRRLATMKNPALLLWGDRDPLVPLAHARAVSHALPHATSLVLENCGHVPQYELPDLTNRLLTRFLA
jgi:pimeloyl-ACP methyl ester carboxylesterase